MESKHELRKQLMVKLAALPADEVERASRAVAYKAFAALDWSKIRTILAYKPLPNSGEVDPSYLLQMVPDKLIDFVASTKDALFPTKQYDLIIVPVLGFDDANFRLGRGGGWYDRFLPTQLHATCIGLAHNSSQLSYLDHDLHDYPLSQIISA